MIEVMKMGYKRKGQFPLIGQKKRRHRNNVASNINNYNILYQK